MLKDIERVLYSEEDIAKRVGELAAQIERDYVGKELVCVCNLKGAAVFMIDLVRKINLPLEMDFIVASSYGRSAETSGVVKVSKDLSVDISGKDVLIVEDIVDTGLTLSMLKEYLKDRGASSLKVCTLLDKPERRRVHLTADYVGYPTPNEFVVGYGLDYAEKYRNVPYIGILKREVYEKA